MLFQCGRERRHVHLPVAILDLGTITKVASVTWVIFEFLCGAQSIFTKRKRVVGGGGGRWGGAGGAPLWRFTQFRYIKRGFGVAKTLKFSNNRFLPSHVTTMTRNTSDRPNVNLKKNQDQKSQFFFQNRQSLTELACQTSYKIRWCQQFSPLIGSATKTNGIQCNDNREL